MNTTTIITPAKTAADASALTIHGADGPLLVIHRDGTVTGSLESAGEAAAIFVREVRSLLLTSL